MAASIVGREVELAALSDFLAAISDGASLLILEGDAGMGKTTLWRDTVGQANARGLRALEAQPAESEAELSFAGLGDLLDPVLDEALAPLPAGQRSALSRALFLEGVEGAAPNAHAVGVALLSAVRALASDAPVLVAVDDVQWLDSASAGALAYAGRRLRDEPIGLLLARRTGLSSGAVDELRRSLGDRATSLDVGPLDAAALHRLISDRLGTTLPRPLVAEVQQASGGNPFYAIEIVRTLQRRVSGVEAGQPLPVPDSLHGLVDERLSTLPDECRHFLLAAAAHAHPTVAITEAASGVVAEYGLDPALGAGIVELDSLRIRFTHPLFAAGILELADARRRIDVHTRLAGLLEDPEARAWQLAACHDEPDEAVAAALEAASAHARGRGAPRPAALLLDRAAELTPEDRFDDRIRRDIEAAYLHFEAGDSRRAEAQLRDMIAPMSEGGQRAKALVMLARIRLYEAPDEARTLFLRVIDEADDSRTLAAAHEGVAAAAVWNFERLGEVIEHTDAALALAEELADEALAADVLLSRITAETLLGLETARATADRALALQESASELRVMDQPLISLAENWLWVDEQERARDALTRLVRRANETGDENGRPWLLCLLGELERSTGDLRRALEFARDAQVAAEQSAQPLFRGGAFALESIIQAQLGRQEETAAAARHAHTASTDRYVDLVVAAALGHLALTLKKAGDAVSHLEPSIVFLRDEGIVEPGAIRFVTDLVEALVELDRRDDAEALLAWYEGNARTLERVSALANSARCHGLLAAQAGDLDSATAAFEEALAWHARVQLPLDLGRTLLALGATQRRSKRRREARETLGAALAIFERIGAALWAERARAELKRISGRAASPGDLTPAEERVAVLVAEGKTNREVAAALFLSDRTVEGHLSHVFGKLGVRHRGEVGPALAARQIQGIDVPNTGDSPVSAELPAP